MEKGAGLSEPVGSTLAMKAGLAVIAFSLVTCFANSASAESAFVSIPNSGRALVLDCSSGRELKLSGPIPTPGGERALPGNAVSVILEYSSGEPQILTGNIVIAEGLPIFVASVEPSDPLVTALNAGEPIRVSRLDRNYVVPPHDNGAEFGSVARSCRGKEPIRSAKGGGTFWRQNGSIMQLLSAGTARKFVFQEPTASLVKAGATAGTIRFEGQIALSTKTYSGTAYIFWQKCGSKPFPVSGQIENDDKRVTLVGQAPQLDEHCAKTGESEQKFVFDFIPEPSK